jgi:hypothetical protein
MSQLLHTIAQAALDAAASQEAARTAWEAEKAEALEVRAAPARRSPPPPHAPPPARSASRPYCPPAGPGFSTRPSLSATSRYPSQAEARSWAAAEAAEAAAAQLRAARRDAAEEKDAALQAVSDMRAQMVAQQAAAEAALLDAASRRVAYVESRSLSVTGVAGPARPSRVHRWHWATPSGLPGVVASPSFSTPLSNSRRPLLRRPARIATLRQS